MIENVRELAMEPQAVIARHMERQCIIEKQVRQEQEREQMALRQAESYGPSLGM